MSGTRGPRLSLLALALLLGMLAPAAVRGAGVEFVAASGDSSIEGPTRFEGRFRSDERPARVEVLRRLAGQEASNVSEATIDTAAGVYEATVELESGFLPNTTIAYRFRVLTANGASLGPEQRLTIADDSLRWQTLDGRFVRLHWHEGDRAFAQRALQIGDEAVARISDLLGVEETEPIDFFVYGDQARFQRALGPGTREYVAGRAIPETRTLFALIEPSEIGSDWVEVVIPHELTHLVFDTAVSNPYHEPPHWLNEGLAVYLSEGYDEGWRSVLEEAVQADRIVPLSGFVARFPPGEERFRLGYAEGVSAVDFFIRRYSQDTLVELVRSYAEGRTDDEAFRDATGADFAAFDAAWQTDVAGATLEEIGPQPGAAGPRPSGWGSPLPTTRPRLPSGTARPSAPDPGGAGSGTAATAAGIVLAGIAVAVVLVVWSRRRAARPSEPPPGWPPFEPPADPPS
jgi:hypothetical protein